MTADELLQHISTLEHRLTANPAPYVQATPNLLERSGSGSAPATDEPAGTREPSFEDAIRQGSLAKPQGMGINCFTLPGVKGMIGVASKKTAGWTKVGVTVDSGAADSVADPESFPGYAVIDHPKPQFFQSATGEPIVNLGEQTVAMVTEEGSLRGMTFQATKKVKKPLASVKRMVEARHAVIFAPDDVGGCFILNLESGETNQLREADGNYMLDVWVPPAESMKGFGRQP